MKTCPYCAEDVKDEAIVCRYCGRDLRPRTAHLAEIWRRVSGKAFDHLVLLFAGTMLLICVASWVSSYLRGSLFVSPAQTTSTIPVATSKPPEWTFELAETLETMYRARTEYLGSNRLSDVSVEIASLSNYESYSLYIHLVSHLPPESGEVISPTAVDYDRLLSVYELWYDLETSEAFPDEKPPVEVGVFWHGNPPANSVESGATQYWCFLSWKDYIDVAQDVRGNFRTDESLVAATKLDDDVSRCYVYRGS